MQEHKEGPKIDTKTRIKSLESINLHNMLQDESALVSNFLTLANPPLFLIWLEQLNKNLEEREYTSQYSRLDNS